MRELHFYLRYCNLREASIHRYPTILIFYRVIDGCLLRIMACSFKSCFEFDKKIQLPHNMIFCGATNSGKTSLFLSSLTSASTNYNPPPSMVYFLYNIFQPSYLEIKEKLMREGIQVEFSQAGDFCEEDLKTLSLKTDGQIIVAIDDATISTSKSRKIAHLFTVARHYRTSMCLFWHVIFANSPESRIISQNTAYFFLLSSPRMLTQVGTLGGQLHMRKAVLSAYLEATNKAYGYILLDLCVSTPGFMRIRGNVFSKPQSVYIKAV